MYDNNLKISTENDKVRDSKKKKLIILLLLLLLLVLITFTFLIVKSNFFYIDKNEKDKVQEVIDDSKPDKDVNNSDSDLIDDNSSDKNNDIDNFPYDKDYSNDHSNDKDDDAFNNFFTGNNLVKFNYTDTRGIGNGISISNAVPLDDTIGSLLIGSNYYFDFEITAATEKHPIKYTIIATKGDNSTLSDDNVKVYLTKIDGIDEVVITDCLDNSKVKKYSQYNNFGNNYILGKKLHQEVIPKNNSNYNSKYRLRIWVSDDAKEWENKEYSLKINVYATEE